MKLEEILSAEQAQAELDKLNARQKELTTEIEKRGADFQTADDDESNTFLDEMRTMKAEYDQNKRMIEDLEKRKERLERETNAMNILDQIKDEKVEERKKQVDKYDTKEYRSAWVKMIRDDDPSEMRALMSYTDGVPVPTYVQGRIETAWHDVSRIVELVSKSNFKGLVKIGYEKSATGATEHGEGLAAVMEETLTLGSVILDASVIKKFITITDLVRAMTPDEFMDYLVDELTYQINLKLENCIVAGTGVTVNSETKGVLGITESDLAESVENDTLSWDLFNTARGKIKVRRGSRAVVIMNEETYFGTVMNLKDSQGRPIYNVISENGAPTYYLNGMEVVFTDALPVWTATLGDDKAYAIVGDLSGYRLNFPDGNVIRFIHDVVTEMTSDEERILGKIAAAGNVVRPKAFAVIKTEPAA